MTPQTIDLSIKLLGISHLLLKDDFLQCLLLLFPLVTVFYCEGDEDDDQQRAACEERNKPLWIVIICERSYFRRQSVKDLTFEIVTNF